MSMLIYLASVIANGAPSLDEIDQAVAKCESKVMVRTYQEEPDRRRAFAIAAYREQEAIVTARQALAARRLAALQPTVGGTMSPPQDQAAAFSLESQQLTERQQELDDARMLNGLREQALDLMRQQYVSKCSAGKFVGQP